MENSLPWTPINRLAKFDAASFILGGEIRNPVNKQTNKQTVNHVATYLALERKALLERLQKSTHRELSFSKELSLTKHLAH